MSQFDIQFTFNGETISAISGQSVGAALLGKTRFNQKGRGVFCGIGVCFDCLVVIDGASNQRACITEVISGMKVQTQVGTNA